MMTKNLLSQNIILYISDMLHVDIKSTHQWGYTEGAIPMVYM